MCVLREKGLSVKHCKGILNLENVGSPCPGVFIFDTHCSVSLQRRVLRYDPGIPENSPVVRLVISTWLPGRRLQGAFPSVALLYYLYFIFLQIQHVFLVTQFNFRLLMPLKMNLR